MNVFHSRRRNDGGPTTGRAREKVVETLKALVVAGVADVLGVERHRWALVVAGLDRTVQQLEQRVHIARC